MENNTEKKCMELIDKASQFCCEASKTHSKKRKKELLKKATECEVLASILVAHQEAVDNKVKTYKDPASGLQVMTEDFLRERGYCCGNGCRHCPYEE